MGMQIYFKHSDLPEVAVVSNDEDYCVIHMPDGDVTAWKIDTNDYYFDCGSTSPVAMANIKNLIRNRVCFTAS